MIVVAMCCAVPVRDVMCDVSGTLTTDDGSKVSGRILPVIIEGDTLDYIGWFDESKDNPLLAGTWYCCADDIIGKSGCTVPGTLIVNPQYASLVHQLEPIQIKDTDTQSFTTVITPPLPPRIAVISQVYHRSDE